MSRSRLRALSSSLWRLGLRSQTIAKLVWLEEMVHDLT